MQTGLRSTRILHRMLETGNRKRHDEVVTSINSCKHAQALASCTLHCEQTRHMTTNDTTCWRLSLTIVRSFCCSLGRRDSIVGARRLHADPGIPRQKSNDVWDRAQDECQAQGGKHDLCSICRRPGLSYRERKLLLHRRNNTLTDCGTWSRIFCVAYEVWYYHPVEGCVFLGDLSCFSPLRRHIVYSGSPYPHGGWQDRVPAFVREDHIGWLSFVHHQCAKSAEWFSFLPFIYIRLATTTVVGFEYDIINVGAFTSFSNEYDALGFYNRRKF